MTTLLMIGSEIGFFFAVAGANLFILAYGLLAPWYKKPFGRHLFAFMLVLCFVLDHNVVQLIFTTYPGMWYVLFVLTWLTAWVIWWRFVILVNVQIRRGFDSAGDTNSTSEVPQVRDDSLAHTGGTDTDPVERVDHLGSTDERVGERSLPLRGVPGSQSGEQ